MTPEGWRNVHWRWHYFRSGESLCGKFTVSIIGGGSPRKPWPTELPSDMHTPEHVCEDCKQKKD